MKKILTQEIEKVLEDLVSETGGYQRENDIEYATLALLKLFKKVLSEEMPNKEFCYKCGLYISHY